MKRKKMTKICGCKTSSLLLILLIFFVLLNDIFLCDSSESPLLVKSQISDSSGGTTSTFPIYPQPSSGASVPLHGPQASAHPHLGQPHHYRHHNNPNFKNIPPGMESGPKPHLVDNLNLKMTTASSASRPDPVTHHSSSASSSAYTIDVDSFVPPGYDKLMPPKENGNPTVVRFHVWVLSLDSIDEGSMTYVADIFMSQSWKDNRLIIPKNITFNVNVSANNDPRGPYRLLPVTLIDKIWRPDSFFKNAKEVTFQEMTIPNHYIWLYSDHTILYMVKLSLLLSCAMKFQTYPHDTQNCTMKIESLSYTTNDLIFDWEESDPLVVEKNIELPQHDLTRKEIDYCTTTYSSGTFSCVQVLFTIKRRLGYYIFHTYIPSYLIVTTSWVSFWLKPEAVPARVTLCVTSLLTLSTQHAQSQKSLPPVSYIKAMDIFMSSCTVFVFFVLLEYALVNILMSDELLNGWIGIIGETSMGPSPSRHVPETPQVQGMLHKTVSPLIYTQSPPCEACCNRESSSSETPDDADEERLASDTIDDEEEESENRLETKAIPKLNATSILAPNTMQHRASFQCLTELTANTKNSFDAFEAKEFKFTSTKPKTLNKRPSSNILSNRKNPSFSSFNKNDAHNSAFNGSNTNKNESRIRRLSQSFSLLKIINNSKSNLKRPQNSHHNPTHPCLGPSPAQHHAHFCPQSHCGTVQVNFSNSNHPQHTFSKLQPLPSPLTHDTCYHSPGITMQSTGCCTPGSASGFAGSSSAAGAGQNNQSYQQKKHRRAYVVDEVSRIIFPLSFIMLNIVYWTYYLNLIDALPIQS